MYCMCMCMGLEWSYLHSQAASSNAYVYGMVSPFPNTKSSYPRGSAQHLWPRVLGRFTELRREGAMDDGDSDKSTGFLDKGGRKADEYEAAPDCSMQCLPRPCT